MSAHEVDSLLAPYAVHAVEPDEARSVQEHLVICQQCRDEVAEYRTTAALMGNSIGEAPEGLWERIAAGLDEPEQEDGEASVSALPSTTLGAPAAPTPPAAPSRRPRRRTVLLLAAAAAVVVVLLLAFQVVRLNGRVSTLRETVAQRGVEQDASEAVLEPHSTVALRSDDSTLDARVVIQPDGTAYMVENSLPTLDAERAYQLWSLGPQGAVSLAVLGHEPRVSAFRVEPSTSRLVITNEPAGGSPGPTAVPLVAGDVV